MDMSALHYLCMLGKHFMRHIADLTNTNTAGVRCKEEIFQPGQLGERKFFQLNANNSVILQASFDNKMNRKI